MFSLAHARILSDEKYPSITFLEQFKSEFNANVLYKQHVKIITQFNSVKDAF